MKHARLILKPKPFITKSYIAQKIDFDVFCAVKKCVLLYGSTEKRHAYLD